VVALCDGSLLSLCLGQLVAHGDLEAKEGKRKMSIEAIWDKMRKYVVGRNASVDFMLKVVDAGTYGPLAEQTT
jgi:hypothetical protein